MTRSASEKLSRFYDQFSGNDSVLIVINADPDAIASAMAVSRLLWRRVLNVTTSHVNTINRPDNLAMLRLLGVTMTPFHDIDPAQFSKIVIVDSQPNHNESMAKLSPDVIIDHPHRIPAGGKDNAFGKACHRSVSSYQDRYQQFQRTNTDRRCACISVSFSLCKHPSGPQNRASRP